MRAVVILFFCFPFIAYANDLSLNNALREAYDSCVGINTELLALKKMAGINTAVTGAGTVAGGVALGTGIAKSAIDFERAGLEKELQDEIKKLQELDAKQTKIDKIPTGGANNSDKQMADNTNVAANNTGENQKKAKLEELERKSKNLGNIRTGTLATAAVADVAGTIIAANNRTSDDLQAQIDTCIQSVEKLSKESIQARLDGADQEKISVANKVIQECGAWDTVDLSKINKRATGAAVSSGIGATMAIAGTIASASANTKTDKNKEKNLNITANVMAGGTTVASGVATIFNATQINAIKHAVAVAEKCEEAFKQ